MMNNNSMSTTEPQPTEPKPGRRRFQYSLRSLLLAFPVVAWCIATGVLGGVFACTVVGTIFLFAKRRTGLAFGVIGIFLLLSCMGVGSSVEFRLDTGDKRLLFWGIPVAYRSPRPELRQGLLALDDSEIPQRWVWCAQQVGSNNADNMMSGFYHEAAAWLEVDPEIARLVLRDIAAYLQTTHATHGLPDCMEMLWPEAVGRDDGQYRVVKGWEKNPRVLAYLARKGYTLHK